MNITLMRYPTEEDWFRAKQCALVTVGKKAITAPTREWKEKLIESRHSPLRTLMFTFYIKEIPSYVSVHLCRHVHAQPYVKSQRNDRQNAHLMNYAQIRHYDIANGDGIRTSLFVSGCNFKCKGCFNKEYQNFNYGNPFTTETEAQILNYINEYGVSGLSILGGEPLEQDETLYEFLKKVKKIGKTIWLWTGFKFESLNPVQRKLVEDCVDILVDGEFKEQLKDMRLKFRGSSNQRIIDVKQTLVQNKIVTVGEKA